MNEPMIIEEINNHIDNSTTEIISNINNANTYAYNANKNSYSANQYAYNSNTYAYGARTNANACNQILSNIYYTNGDTKKSWHLYSISCGPLNLQNVNGILHTIYFYNSCASYICNVTIDNVSFTMNKAYPIAAIIPGSLRGTDNANAANGSILLNLPFTNLSSNRDVSYCLYSLYE